MRERGRQNRTDFIAPWAPAQASERSNNQTYLIEFGGGLGVTTPHPATGDAEADGQVFERPVTFQDGPTL